MPKIQFTSEEKERLMDFWNELRQKAAASEDSSDTPWIEPIPPGSLDSILLELFKSSED